MPTANDRKKNTLRWRRYYKRWRAKNKNYHRDKQREYRSGEQVVMILGVKVKINRRKGT